MEHKPRIEHEPHRPYVDCSKCLSSSTWRGSPAEDNVLILQANECNDDPRRCARMRARRVEA
jgi:hypothetical protein